MQQRNASISIENILKLDKDKKLKISELQKLQTERNSISKLIGTYKKDQKETIDLEKKVTEIKRNTVVIEKSLKIIEEKLNQIILRLPNIPDEDVPIGENERHNKEILKKFTPIDFKFDPIPHDVLGKNLNKMMDFDLGSSISGARSVCASGCTLGKDPSENSSRASKTSDTSLSECSTSSIERVFAP